MGRLDGQTIVVTGGAGFLGQQYMKAIALEGGFAVSLDKVPSADVVSLTCDITDRNAVIQAYRTIRVMVPGRITGLVNNAAINPTVSQGWLQESGRFETMDYVAFRREFEVGIMGAIICSQIFGADMARAGKGSIVNISSELGLVSPNQGLYGEGHFKPVGYSIIKHGVIGLTRWLATYWAEKGVRVNALAPGGMEKTQGPKFISKRSKLIPMKRMSRPGEYNGPLVFLLSDDSSYMTGSVLSVDGGYTAW
jgi:NAD(P)-dependent dehydrogenase (short-subunit alcohol dehydrogenase family)